MEPESEEPTPIFKDYCLILQIHPEADAAMLDTAYWHLVRRYSEARKTDPSAKAKMDDLNEAYCVLRSPTQREEYFRTRDAFLGEGALPEPPLPTREAPPLAVMEKQRVMAREDPEVSHRARRPLIRLTQLRVPSRQNILVGLILLMLGSAALLSWTHPLLVAALVATGVVFASVPLLYKLRALLTSRLPRRVARTHTNPTSQPQRVGHSTDAIRERWREGGQADAPWTATPVDASLAKDAPLEPPADRSSTA